MQGETLAIALSLAAFVCVCTLKMQLLWNILIQNSHLSFGLSHDIKERLLFHQHAQTFSKSPRNFSKFTVLILYHLRRRPILQGEILLFMSARKTVPLSHLGSEAQGFFHDWKKREDKSWLSLIYPPVLASVINVWARLPACWKTVSSVPPGFSGSDVLLRRPVISGTEGLSVDAERPLQIWLWFKIWKKTLKG